MGKNLVRTRQALGFRRGALGPDLLGVKDWHAKLFVPADGGIGLVAFIVRLVFDILLVGQLQKDDSRALRLRRWERGRWDRSWLSVVEFSGVWRRRLYAGAFSRGGVLKIRPASPVATEKLSYKSK
jgi:hypothetical protein